MYVHQLAGRGEIAETDGRNGMIASGASRANVRRPTPKYHRLEADLRRRISAGEFAVGLVLRPEHDLSRVLRAEAGVITEDDPDPLRPEWGAPCYRLTRIGMGGSEPIGVQRTTVLTRDCPDFGRHDFARESVYSVSRATASTRHVFGAEADQPAVLLEP